MTLPRPPLPGPPRPGPLPGAPRPGMAAGAPRPGPDPAAPGRTDDPVGRSGEGTGHPAVDAVLRALANAVALPPADQIAEYEAAHRVLQETLASIDRA